MKYEFALLLWIELWTFANVFFFGSPSHEIMSELPLIKWNCFPSSEHKRELKVPQKIQINRKISKTGIWKGIYYFSYLMAFALVILYVFNEEIFSFLMQRGKKLCGMLKLMYDLIDTVVRREQSKWNASKENVREMENKMSSKCWMVELKYSKQPHAFSSLNYTFKAMSTNLWEFAFHSKILSFQIENVPWICAYGACSTILRNNRGCRTYMRFI